MTCRRSRSARQRASTPSPELTAGPDLGMQPRRPRLRVSSEEMDSAVSEEFDELYRTSRERLAVQIVALSGSHQDAEDAVQEAFVRAWLRWKTVGAYDDPEAWVRRVAYNLAVSRWRRTRRVVLQAVVPGPHGREPGEPIGIVEAMKVLPLTQRRALVLHHLGGLSVSGIAQEMSVPEGTVKSWLSRARTRLSEELERREELAR